MSPLRRFAAGLRALFTRDRVERELDADLRDWIEAAAANGERAGLEPDAARRAARVRMGSLDAVKEAVRDAGWESTFGALLRDLRYGTRVLRKHPGFTATAVLTLALGIGANTAIVSVVSAVLLHPLPYPGPERLADLGPNSLPDILDLADQSRTFEAVGAAAPWALDLVGQGEPLRIDGALIGGDLFATLGVAPMLGRTFTETDARALAADAVVSHRFWTEVLGADPAAVGRPLVLSGRPYVVVGVMPEGFRLPSFAFRSEVWVPLRVAYPDAVDARGAHFLRAVGRLRAGVSLETAQAELVAISARLREAHPTEARPIGASDLRESLVGDMRRPLLLLTGAVGFVLLIACSNVASLLLARSVARGREMQVRHALGASRGRLLRMLLTEAALLSLAGAAGGIVIATQAIRLLMRFAPEDLPAFRHVALDLTTLAVTLLVSLFAGLLFGLGPAWHAWRLRATRPSEERTTGDRAGARRVLVVAEIALAAVLLIGAGLLVRSFQALQGVDLGFEPDDLLTLRLDLPIARYAEIPAQEEFLTRLDRELAGMPGVAAAGMVSELPLTGWRMMHNMIVEGQPAVAEGSEPEIYAHEVSPAFFATLETPLTAGRAFTEADRAGAPLVGIVNEAFARRYFPAGNALGGRARWARGTPDAWMTIVGVVRGMRFEGIDEEQPPTFYTPLAQKQQPWKRWTWIALRSPDARSPRLAEAAKATVWRLDPALPVTAVATMPDVLTASVSARRFNLVLLSAFAVVAMLLAAIGVYGVLAHLVALRRREVGVRVALGALPADILWLMLRQATPLVAWGVLCGGVGALLLTRLLRALLWGVSPTDPMTFGAVLAGLATLGLVASVVPARRALRVDPAEVLRSE
ncbi:MAG TPA: ABC transporter permease [Candidatus Polarisedimenticolia bacterium]|nr:ABC transporter permease [Candidatus Polarisedimenticolia bacterium]